MSLRQIGRMIGVDGSQNVKHHLEQLRKRGFMSADFKLQRKVGNLKKRKISSTSMVAIPIFGSANCGEALEFADEKLQGFLRVSSSMLSRNKKDAYIALSAVGNSMNAAKLRRDNTESNIEDGDYVIVDVSKRSPNNGDYVVSIIDDSANIKRFFRDDENSQVLLVSESKEKVPPICIHKNDFSHYSIVGEVVQVVRQRYRRI